MKRRLALMCLCLAGGVTLALLFTLLQPNRAKTGDFADVPEFVPGMKMVPARDNVSAIFGDSSAARVDPSFEVRPGLSIAEAADAMNTSKASVPQSWLPGTPDLSSVRALITGIGPASRTIYAYTTDRGKVCSGLTGVSSGCLPGFSEEAPFAWTFVPATAEEPALIWGMIPDYVTEVDVSVGGMSHVAELRNNAYVFQAASAATRSFDSLTVKLSDGTSRTTNLPTAAGTIDELHDVTP